ARIGGHAAHDCEQRAGGQTFDIVNWLMLADGSEQQVVLALVHVVFLARPRPVGFAFDLRCWAAANSASPIGSENVIGILVVAAYDLPVCKECAHAIRVEVVDLEMIVDVTAFGRNHTATNGHTAL